MSQLAFADVVFSKKEDDQEKVVMKWFFLGADSHTHPPTASETSKANLRTRNNTNSSYNPDYVNLMKG